MFVIFGLLSLIVSAASGNDVRIIGGTETTIEKFPYVVQVVKKEANWFSAGVILSKNWVLTVANVVNESVVKAGITSLSGDNVYKVSETIRCPYNNETDRWTHYLALLKLKDELPLNGKTMKAIQISEIKPKQGDNVTIVGWGQQKYDSHDKLRVVTVPITKIFDTVTKFHLLEIGGKGKGACFGDESDPLTETAGKLIGIVVVIYESPVGCVGEALAVDLNEEFNRAFIKKHTGL